MRPRRVPRESVVRGQSFTGVYYVQKEDGSPEDLSGKEILFRLSSQSDGAILDRYNGNVGEIGFPSGQTGVEGYFYPVLDHPATSGLAAGFYDLAIWTEDEGVSPDDRRPIAVGLFEVKEPKGGFPTPLDA